MRPSSYWPLLAQQRLELLDLAAQRIQLPELPCLRAGLPQILGLLRGLALHLVDLRLPWAAQRCPAPQLEQQEQAG